MTLIYCTNRGCMKSSEAKLDTATNEVICAECGGVIVGITEMMKRQLKDCRQIVRVKNKQAFQTFCKQCKGNTEYAVDSDGRAFCKICKQPVSVSPIFARMVSERKTKDGDE